MIWVPFVLLHTIYFYLNESVLKLLSIFILSINSYMECMAAMSVFYSILSVAILRAPYQVLPTRPNSLFTYFLCVSLGLCIFLSPWRFHCKASFSMALSGFLKICPIYFYLRFLITIWIGSWSVFFPWIFVGYPIRPLVKAILDTIIVRSTIAYK